MPPPPQRRPERIEQEEKFRVEEKPKRDEEEDMYVTNGVKKVLVKINHQPKRRRGWLMGSINHHRRGIGFLKRKKKERKKIQPKGERRIERIEQKRKTTKEIARPRRMEN